MPGVEVRAGATGPTADPRRGYAALMGTEVVDVKASPGSRWGRDHDRNAPSDGAGEPLAPRLACDEAQAHIQGLPQLGALLGFAQEPTPERRRGSPAPRGLRRSPPSRAGPPDVRGSISPGGPSHEATQNRARVLVAYAEVSDYRGP